MENNDIKLKTKLFTSYHIMIEQSLHGINKTAHHGSKQTTNSIQSNSNQPPAH